MTNSTGRPRALAMRFFLGVSAAALAAGVSGAAAAQNATTGDADKSQAVSEVTVTGSRIEGLDTQSANPVSVIGNLQIETTNTITVDDVLRKLPSTGNRGPTAAAPLGNQTGVSGVDLRDLGANRTLILENGRRYTPTATIGGVVTNLDTIPVSLIDHIEVLRDGASPTYGADAVAGVINVITKKNFEGFQADFAAGQSSRSDRDVGRLSFTIGRNFGDGAGNVVANVDYGEKDSIDSKDRPFSARTATFARNPDGSYTAIFGGPFSPGGTTVIGGAPVQYVAPGVTAPLDPVQLFVEDSESTLVGRLITLDGTLQAHYDFSPQVQGYFEGSYSSELYANRGGPVTFNPGRSSKYPTAGSVPADNPFNTTGAAINTFFKEYDGVGVRVEPTQVQTWRVLGGFRGKFPNGWNWDASYQYGGSNTQSQWGNNLNVPHLLNAMDPVLCAAAPGCVVLNPFGPTSITPAMANYIRQNDEIDNHYREHIAQVVVDGALATLPAGPLAFSLGAEYRREEGGSTYDPLILAGDASLTTAVNTEGEYNTKDVFGELNVPLLKDVALAKSLELNLSARYSDYSTFGGHSTWKAGVNWAVSDDVRFRGSIGTAFRAPDINEAFGGLLNTFASYADPCDVVTGLRSNPAINAGCTAAGLGATFRQTTPKTTATTGGNRNLRPETADEYGLGVVLQPHWLTGFSATVDYYNIKLQNAVGNPAFSTALSNCYSAFSASNPDCARITRDPVTGQVSQIRLTKINVGGIRTNGVDFDVNYVTDASNVGLGGGRISARLQGTYLLSYKQQTVAGGAFTQAAGHYSPSGAFSSAPRFRATGDLGYLWGDWGLNWDVRFIQGMQAVNANPNTSPPQYLQLPDVYYHDVTVTYRHAAYQVAVGVENLTDRLPPFILNPSANYDSSTYDVVGRFFFAKLSIRY